MYDTIIIGGGPAGSQVARRLAELDHRVMVFEQRRELGDGVCCTGIIGRECYEHFSFSQELVLREARSAKFFSPSGKVVRLAREDVQAYLVHRGALDSLWARRAQEKGAHYLLESSVRGVALEENGVLVEVDLKGERKRFRARTAVIASGFGSRLPRLLGLGRVDRFVMGAQAEVKVEGIEEVEVYLGQERAPGFFAWLVPTAEGKGLVGLLSRGSPTPLIKRLLATLLTQGKISHPIGRIAYKGLPLTPLTKSYAPRVIAVGDAAGQVKPTTGGGIYYGLLCADLGAEVLSRALREGDFSEAAFARYEKRWKGRLRYELQIGSYARRLYQRLSDRHIDALFDLIQTNGMAQWLQKSNFSFDWHADLILRALRRNLWPALTQIVKSSLLYRPKERI